MKLLYIADPMCSWCYGFGPVVDGLLADPARAPTLQFALMMGGLRPYTTEALSPEGAAELQAHWQAVAEAAGVPFAPAPHAALTAPGFVYDTEPASRATLTVRRLSPRHVWRYFKSVQQAFYAEGRDVTRPEVLADLAEAAGLPRAEFATAFAAETMREATRAEFAQVQGFGIRGFPALLAEHGDSFHLVAHGHVPLATVQERLDALAAG